MIIWGWKTRLQRLGAGTFSCPACDASRTCEQVAARRWFTLFFIPLVPLQRLGSFVRCSTCASTFDPAVLEQRGIEHATFAPSVPAGGPLPPPSAR